MDYQTLKVRFDNGMCFLQLHRPEANNTINETMIHECLEVLKICEQEASVVILEGLPEVFCFGADFDGIVEKLDQQQKPDQNPQPLYQLWLMLAKGSFVSVAHVRGQVNAGGVGFVAACDLVLAESAATFSLSELLFDLFPACVLPFLVRRTGVARANTITLGTKPIDANQALSLGLVDEVHDNSQALLRKHLLRLRLLSKKGVRQYKQFMHNLDDSLLKQQSLAIDANQAIFSDSDTLQKIYRYKKTGLFPWEE